MERSVDNRQPWTMRRLALPALLVLGAVVTPLTASATGEGRDDALRADPGVEALAAEQMTRGTRMGATTASDLPGATGATGPLGVTGATGATGPSGPVTIRLSDEKKLSRWAFVIRRVSARSAPDEGARIVKRLTTSTPDKTSELVLTLSERTNEDGSVWVLVRLPMRPNNRTGWVPRGSLGDYEIVRDQLVIKRRSFRATLYRRGRKVWSAAIGVGQARWPTPKGKFYVRDRLIPTNKNSVYGVFAFGLSAYSAQLTDWPGGGMVGIHGTNQPGLIPGRISHGCIRVRNAKIAKLKRMMSVGTPVRVI